MPTSGAYHGAQAHTGALSEGLIVHRLARLLTVLSIALLSACSSFFVVPQRSSGAARPWTGTYVENQSQTVVDFGEVTPKTRGHAFIQPCESMLSMVPPYAGTTWTLDGQTIREFSDMPSATIQGIRLIVAPDGSPTIEFVDHPIRDEVTDGKCPKEPTSS